MLLRASHKCNRPGFYRRGYYFPIPERGMSTPIEVDLDSMDEKDREEFKRVMELGFLVEAKEGEAPMPAREPTSGEAATLESVEPAADVTSTPTGDEPSRPLFEPSHGKRRR